MKDLKRKDLLLLGTKVTGKFLIFVVVKNTISFIRKKNKISKTIRNNCLVTKNV